MPLQVFAGDYRAKQIYSSVLDFPGRHCLDVGMGGYAVAHAAHATAIVTDGAGPCQIIVVHKARGWGALGHYPGWENSAAIVDGVREMVQALGGGPIATVVFAAGSVNKGRRQLNYEIQIVAQVRSVCAGARVLWPTAPEPDTWGACIYLPQAEQVGLLLELPGSFVGYGKPADGLTAHNYGE